MNQADKITFRAWDKSSPPQKILVIRFHAIGDTAITIPVCAGFKKIYPETQIDFLTGSASSALLKASQLFRDIYDIPLNVSSNIFNKLGLKFLMFRIGNHLKQNCYDVVLDLQHNNNSRIIRSLTGVKHWSEFDRYAPKPASKRTLDVFDNAGFKQIDFDYDWKLRPELLQKAKNLLITHKWDEKEKLLILNPAGLWKTRNWPIDNYVSLALKILNGFNIKFILLGTQRMIDKSNYLSSKLGDKIINLTGKTTLEEALAITNLCSMIVSEDSALFHLAWAAGIPSILLLGSTRADWTCQPGKHVICLNSNDLPCGNCMDAECKFGDVHCLSRFTPELVYEKAKLLLNIH